MSRFKASIPIDPKGYRWVNLGGYEESDGRESYEGSLFLIGNSEEAVHQEWHDTRSASLPGDPYDPFITEPALFRIFSGLEVTEEAILRFVDRYGGMSTIFDVIEDTEQNSLAIWRERIEEMRESVRLADTYLASQKNSRKVLDLVNEILGWAELHATADKQPNGGMAILVVAHDLWSAMRLQLAEAIVDQKQFRNCEHCSKPFEISPQFTRSDRQFCSDNCRVKAHYRRKQKAIAMRADGATLRQIVKELGSESETIKKWLESAQAELSALLGEHGERKKKGKK